MCALHLGSRYVVDNRVDELLIMGPSFEKPSAHNSTLQQHMGTLVYTLLILRDELILL